MLLWQDYDRNFKWRWTLFWTFLNIKLNFSETHYYNRWIQQEKKCKRNCRIRSGIGTVYYYLIPLYYVLCRLQILLIVTITRHWSELARRDLTFNNRNTTLPCLLITGWAVALTCYHCKKHSSLQRVFKDIPQFADLKQQILQKMVLLVQHIDKMSTNPGNGWR